MELLNLSEWKPEGGFLSAVRSAFEDLGVDVSGITVALVDSEYMASLKERFFGERTTTDVLTFVYDDVREVVVCPSHLNYDPYEVARRIFHGVLHALGYDHKIKSKAPKMERMEMALMKAFKRRFAS